MNKILFSFLLFSIPCLSSISKTLDDTYVNYINSCYSNASVAKILLGKDFIKSPDYLKDEQQKKFLQDIKEERKNNSKLSLLLDSFAKKLGEEFGFLKSELDIAVVYVIHGGFCCNNFDEFRSFLGNQKNDEDIFSILQNDDIKEKLNEYRKVSKIDNIIPPETLKQGNSSDNGSGKPDPTAKKLSSTSSASSATRRTHSPRKSGVIMRSERHTKLGAPVDMRSKYENR